MYFYFFQLIINALIFRNHIEKLSDNELISLYQQKGDKQVIGILYKRYTGFVFAVCMKYLRSKDDSSDAVMQIFEKLFSDLKVHTVTNFKSWLYTVAKNHCLHTIRKQKSEKEKGADFVKNSDEVMENNSSLYHDGEEILELKLTNLEQALCNIPPEQRTCIELFYLKQKSYKEIVEITGYSENQVKSYIQNGKRNLKISLSNDEG